MCRPASDPISDSARSTACGTDRHGAPVDLRALPGLDTDMDGLCHALRDKTPGAPGRLGIGKRFFELSYDLVFAHDHRFYAGSKRKEVPQRVAAVKQKEVFPALADQEIAEVCRIAFDQNFDSVAGLEEEYAAKLFFCSGKECSLIREPERFERRDICGLVADTGNGKSRLPAVHARYLLATRSQAWSGDLLISDQTSLS